MGGDYSPQVLPEMPVASDESISGGPFIGEDTNKRMEEITAACAANV